MAWILGVVHGLMEGTDAGTTWFVLTVAAAVLPPFAMLAARHAAAPRRTGDGMRFACFGGTCEVRAADPAAEARARDRLLDLHARFTRFDPASELERLNADPRPAVRASAELRALARAVRHAGERTGGLVDGTLAAEIAAAGYAGATPPRALPPALALRLAPRRRPAGPSPEQRWRTISAGLHAVHRPPGVRIDSGGLAKGLFADLVAEELGTGELVVAAAGDLRIRSRRPRAGPRRRPVRPPHAAHVPAHRRGRRDERDHPPRLARRRRPRRPPPARPCDRPPGVHRRRPGHRARADRARGRDPGEGRAAQRAGGGAVLAAARRRRRPRRRPPRGLRRDGLRLLALGGLIRGRASRSRNHSSPSIEKFGMTLSIQRGNHQFALPTAPSPRARAGSARSSRRPRPPRPSRPRTA